MPFTKAFDSIDMNLSLSIFPFLHVFNHKRFKHEQQSVSINKSENLPYFVDFEAHIRIENKQTSPREIIDDDNYFNEYI